MTDDAVGRDVRIGVGSLLVFAAAVAGLLLGFPFVGALLAGAGGSLLATGITGTRASDLSSSGGD
jgi:hypothetical protein